MKKEDYINKLIKDQGYKSYLEIGIYDAYNYDKIVCDHKTGIDPILQVNREGLVEATSDKFFKNNDAVFDVIFIDGDHTSEQVRKDINNACRSLSYNGAIVIHDTYPHNEEMQEVPRKVKHWTGDCWRAVVGFIQKYPDVITLTHKCDYGLTIIFPNGKKPRAKYEVDMDYKHFEKDKDILLNVVRD